MKTTIRKITRVSKNLQIEEPKKLESKKRKRNTEDEVWYFSTAFLFLIEYSFSCKKIKKTWTEISTIELNRMYEYLAQFQSQENIILLSLKAKKKKDSKDYIYKCKDDGCPFLLKLTETKSKIKSFTSNQHNHGTTLISIGNKFEFLLVTIIIFRSFKKFKKYWNQPKNKGKS